MENWRECVGIEPTQDGVTASQTVLKTARATRPHSPPETRSVVFALAVDFSAEQDAAIGLACQDHRKDRQVEQCPQRPQEDKEKVKKMADDPERHEDQE